MTDEPTHKPVLIVIAGPNGSGKTTVTSKILRHEWMEDAEYINPDIVAQERFGFAENREYPRHSLNAIRINRQPKGKRLS